MLPTAKQHAVAGHQAHILDQHAGNAVDVCVKVGIGPTDSGALHAQPVTVALAYPPVDQFGGAVELRGELQLGSIEEKLGQLIDGGQVIASEGIDRGRARHVSRLKTQE
jgi:hypothetical protein